MTRRRVTTDVHIKETVEYNLGVRERRLQAAAVNKVKADIATQQGLNWDRLMSQLPSFFMRKARVGRDLQGNKCKVLPIGIRDLRKNLETLAAKEFGGLAPDIREVDITTYLAKENWVRGGGGITHVIEIEPKKVAPVAKKAKVTKFEPKAKKVAPKLKKRNTW